MVEVKFEVNTNGIHVHDIRATFPVYIENVKEMKKSNANKLILNRYCHGKMGRQ